MSDSPNESTILIVDSLPLRNFGLVALLDRLSGTTKFRFASLTPDDAERWIGDTIQSRTQLASYEGVGQTGHPAGISQPQCFLNYFRGQGILGKSMNLVE